MGHKPLMEMAHKGLASVLELTQSHCAHKERLADITEVINHLMMDSRAHKESYCNLEIKVHGMVWHGAYSLTCPPPFPTRKAHF